MNLWEHNYTRRELEGFTGDLRQIADIQTAVLDDGLERGVRVALVRTGSGLDFTVLLDRAMDIGTATYHGIPLAWQSGLGATSPARYDPREKGWLDTFHGGLLALCGLTQVGYDTNAMTDPDNGDILGLHGRINTIPAHDIHVERAWNPDAAAWRMQLSGLVDEVSIFGYRLRLERTLSFTVGQPTFEIHDRVRNIGGQPAPLMILYHCNLGWPLVAPDTVITSPTTHITPRDAVAAPGLKEWNRLQAPTPGYAEQVFLHHVESTEPFVSAVVTNPSLKLGLEISFTPNTLNCLTEWKMMGYSTYVLGIEPGNCFPLGRVAVRNAGGLRMLQPDETETFGVRFGIQAK